MDGLLRQVLWQISCKPGVCAEKIVLIYLFVIALFHVNGNVADCFWSIKQQTGQQTDYFQADRASCFSANYIPEFWSSICVGKALVCMRLIYPIKIDTP